MSEVLIPLAIGIVAYVLLKTFVVTLDIIPSESMLPTIEVGDHIIGSRFATPSAGDIVTFSDPTNPDVVLIKRVVATEGETVDLRDGQLYVNGQPRRFGREIGETQPIGANLSYPITVGEGQVLCMGDNREHSVDSRAFGPVPTSSIRSVSAMRYWPPQRMGAI